MYNLFVDDVRPVPDGWLVARTIEDAKSHLSTGAVDRLSLDHDMGACAACIASGEDIGDMTTPETTYMHWCKHEQDGTKLMLWIIDTGNWSRQKPTVHSANPVGGARMRGMIERYWNNRPS
jgi:hypothetical protein